MGATILKDTMETFKSVIRTSGAIAAILIRQKFYRYTIENVSTMKEEIQKFQGYKQELVILDDKISDEDFVLPLLTALLDIWNSFIDGLDPSIESKVLIGRILAEEV